LINPAADPAGVGGMLQKVTQPPQIHKGISHETRHRHHQAVQA
jgi:hypothetical protein